MNHEHLSKWNHIVKITALTCALMALVYTMGWYMTQDNCRKKVVDALKAGNCSEAAKVLFDRQVAGAKPDAFMWQAAAAISFKTGNLKLAEACITKSLESGE